MIKRPKRNETEEDILRMQQEFLEAKSKNPKLQPAAALVKVDKKRKKSLFAKSREESTLPLTSGPSSKPANEETSSQVSNFVFGEIVEKRYDALKAVSNATEQEEYMFPKIEKLQHIATQPGKSIFAMAMDALNDTDSARICQTESMECDTIEKRNLNEVFGASSVLIEDNGTAPGVHKENLTLLSKMSEHEILAERNKLLESIDPAIVALLAKRKLQKTSTSCTQQQTVRMEIESSNETTNNVNEQVLDASNAAVDLLKRNSAEQWIHFDVVEADKLAWMRDIPQQALKLKPGEKFEARFDWKGVLLPYSTDDDNEKTTNIVKDERELYLHGEEPHRPGYTLQELFRLARSNVMQQRVTAFGAIGGILNIYNQGFYDQVLELPIAKIFFLLRFGFDDNTPAMLETVSKALSFLFYNETDETLLDFIYDNPAGYWQPILQVLDMNGTESDDPTSIENLQKQMQQLQMNANTTTNAYKANIDETEAENKTSMSDFQLAETDLIDCFLRTNIVQRIYFILHNVRPDNSTVTSCLKLLIRLARAGKEVAKEIANNDELWQCLFDNFLPGLELVDTTLESSRFYSYPQYLCLKLIRILISQNLSIALKFMNLKVVDKLQNYLFSREDIKSTLIKVQIEALRILRCLQLLGADNTLYKKFLPAFRNMLEWHFNHDIFVGGPFLIRQHAAALLAAITSSPGGIEVGTLLADLLYVCCSSWFYKATRSGVHEFSQMTLLSASLNVVAWYTRYIDAARFRKFNEKYLRDFIASETFVKLLKSLLPASVISSKFNDRRNVHAPLPNVGAIAMHKYGPRLVLPQTYAVFLITALWRLLELQLERQDSELLDTLVQPQIVEPIIAFLRALSTNTNRCLATNFYAKAELKLIFKLLCFEGFGVYFERAQFLQVVYNFLCCLTAEHIPEIEQLFNRVIFNKAYLNVDEETLEKWRCTSLELVYPHYIVLSPGELTLSMPFTQFPVLPSDWPYFQLKIILQNYVENVQQKSTIICAEQEVLRMTFTFVSLLEDCNPEMQIVTPTEKLMYLMIAFMGAESQFLETEMHAMLEKQLLRFYAKCKDVVFEFDATFEGKCKYENLYALFVDHFQAASYGDELFSSLVLVPLAQKYNNKWRRRVWSDYGAVLRFLNCSEQLLIGGLQAYLEPAEEESSLLKAYSAALNSKSLRVDSIPHKIAKHHVEKLKERLNLKAHSTLN